MYQILISCNKMQINYFKIIQCDFQDFCFRFRLSQLKCTYDKKLQTSTCFVSGKTCKIGSVSNTCSPHCILRKRDTDRYRDIERDIDTDNDIDIER